MTLQASNTVARWPGWVYDAFEWYVPDWRAEREILRSLGVPIAACEDRGGCSECYRPEGRAAVTCSESWCSARDDLRWVEEEWRCQLHR